SDDDGHTWTGMRELYLDPRRNEPGYAYEPGIDRGVHQSQFVEPVPGKVLVALGQNRGHRALVLFDVRWLYEKERYCDFSDSLAQWCTFNYYKGIQGHCAYNRTEGCRLKEHPGKPGRRILNIAYTPDDTLVIDNRGAVWNFPALRKGSVTVSLRLPEKSQEATMLLNDRWFNPCDTVARYFAPVATGLSRSALGIEDAGWHEVKISWDLDKTDGGVALYVDGKRKKKRLPLHCTPSQAGLSYLHFISGNIPDEQGIDIEWVKAESTAR
ncbi:MAG: exo-alpha-sialidase, partial [Parabacteroides sp.]|nr:exo-alpha-sialidase [Parabacteroides sp.]